MEALDTSPYLLLNGLALIAGLLLLEHRLEKRLPQRRDVMYVLFVLAVVFGWVGAHVLAWLVGNQSFGRAGFAFYGGLISGAAFLATTALGFRLVRPEELSTALNAAVVPLLVAHGIGRIGCFLAGCCYGTSISGTTAIHPTQLYESGFLFSLGLILALPGRHPSSLRAGDAAVYLVTYPVFRFFLEFLRDDPRGEALGLSTSQWISLVLVGGAFFLHLSGLRPGSETSTTDAPGRVGGALR